MTVEGISTPIEVVGHKREEKTLRHIWNECVGAGRANEALRADWQRHFQEAVDVLGVRHVRFHGLFHDDMFVYRASNGGGFAAPHGLSRPIYTFSYVDKVFDAVLDAGARPFVEFSFMPRELATQTETLFWWKAHCSPPKDHGEWADLVGATVSHWIDRYGIDEVRTWPFEVWNEPNLVPHFWTGTKSEYLQLYDVTARRLKEIDAHLKVGGPATSVFVPDERYDGEYHDKSKEATTAEAVDPDALTWKPVWIHEFIEYCTTNDLPIDFISTHLYPTDYAYDTQGVGRAISRNRNATFEDLLVLRDIIAASQYPDVEVHITEWSTSPSSRDFMHDTLFAATYITRAFLQSSELADSISYWTFTDVFEEGGAGIGPFHGGFGLVNEQGIHKPTFHAMRMLGQLGEELLMKTENGVITQKSDGVSAVFFNYPDSMEDKSVGSAESYEDARRHRDEGPSQQISFDISGLRSGARYLYEAIDWEHGNIAEEWHAMGRPVNLTRDDVRHLKVVADDLDRKILEVSTDGTLSIDVELAPWAVASITPINEQ